MKKLVVLLMAALFLMSLAACGGTSAQDGGEVRREEAFVPPEGSVRFVWVQINPEFELYIHESGTITALVCCNKDAEKAFAGVDVTGLGFENGFEKLLNAAHSAGYASGNEVHLTWGISHLSDADFDDSILVDGFARATERFADQNNMGLSASMAAERSERPHEDDAPPQDEATPPQEEEANPFGPDVEILERDAEGRITKTREYDSAGSEVLTVYDAEGRVVLIAVTRTDGGVAEIKRTYYANGKIQTEEINDYGTHIHELWTYSQDGKSRTAEADTYTVTETYHDNGACASVVRQAKSGYDLGDRTYEKYTYDESGQTLTHFIIRTNGAHITSTYHSEHAFTMVVEVNGKVDHTEYWVGNDHIGGIDSNGNPYGITHAEYTGTPNTGGTIGVG